MPRFICNNWPYQKIQYVGRTLAFNRGVLDADEQEAAFIRALPEYGRVITEGQESDLTRAEKHRAETRARIRLLESHGPYITASERISRALDKLFYPERIRERGNTRPAAADSKAEAKAVFYHALEASRARKPGPYVRKAIEFVETQFSENPEPPVRETILLAKSQGVYRYSLERAKKYLGVRSAKLGMREGWVWVRTQLQRPLHLRKDSPASSYPESRKSNQAGNDET